MEKDEILKRAQSENVDERQLQIRDKSIKWTYITMVVAAAIFAYIRGSKNQPIMDLCVTVCASVFVGQLYRYVKSKDKWYLLIGTIAFAAAGISLVRFLMGY